MAPLLIHSLAEFRGLIFRCLDVVGARSVVEIGAEDGTFTQELLCWARDHAGVVAAVQPFPTAAVRELAATWPELQLVEQRSPAALDHLAPADAYLIDGDHNYATLSGELDVIYGYDGDRPTVVFLHDVGWPSGRRDMYYDPENLPADAVHPHTYAKGVVPGCEDVVDGGFRGAGQFAWARREGGPANGVRTAVEDFLKEHDQELAFVTVPCVFGLGVLFPTSAPWASAIAAVLAPYDDNDLLRRLEQNRLSLYLAVLRLQDEQAASRQSLEQMQLERRDVDAENRALWARLAELEQQAQVTADTVRTLRDEIAILAPSRAFAIAEHLSRARGLAGGRGPQLSRRRLRQALETSPET